MATSCWWVRVVCALSLVGTAGCVYEFAEVEPRQKGSVGAELYRVVCKRLAAQAFPNDLTGERFEAPCASGDATSVAAIANGVEHDARNLPRLQALLERRALLVPALDSVFESDTFEQGELRGFLLELLPFYDPPEALMQDVTATTAELLGDLITSEVQMSAEAMEALGRVAQRDGYRPLRLALGLARPVLAYPGLDSLVDSTLEAFAPETGSARAEWEALLEAATFDLATAEVSEDSEAGTLAVARQLLFAEADAFSAGGPLYTARRDRRGYALGALDVVGPPFLDEDGDGLADLDELGRFRTTLLDGQPAEPPFTTLAAQLAGIAQGERDAAGRALNPVAPGELLYRYLDVDRTLIAGVTRDLGPLLLPSEDGGLDTAAIHNFSYGLSAVLGEWGERTAEVGGRTITYNGPDTNTGPAFDLVWALGSLLPFEQSDQLLQVLEILVRDHESEVAALMDAGLFINERADAYPDAAWATPHEFWDDLLAWNQRVLQRPGMLEAMVRAFTTEEAALSGPLLGNFMRYRDRVTYRQGKLEELSAQNIDMTQVIGNLGSDSVSDAVQAHRTNVNFPCEQPPRGLFGGSVGDEGCVPQAELPADHHRGIRTCPDEAPSEGASCADMSGYGLCSYDTGSCVCDCEGGLCRGDASPTWRCGLPATRGYAEWVDRSQPDLRFGADGVTNQSLFQRTASLVHDLHGPAKLCNKGGAAMKIYDPAGSNNEFLFGIGGLILPSNIGECELLEEDEIVQFFTHAILGKAELELQTGGTLQLVLNIANFFGITVSQLMERQTQLRGMFVERPTPQAVARLVFSPFNSFQADLLELPTTRDRLDIVDYHRDTIFAWEVPDPLAGVSYYQALTPLLTAMDENELRDADGNLLDGYLFGDLITLLHNHWSSPHADPAGGEMQTACLEDNGDLPDSVCVLDPNQPHNAFRSNGMSYEELVAEALIDAQLLSRVRDLLLALQSIQLEDGSDGITVLVRAAEDLLDPARSCDGDCAANPLRKRSGQTGTTTNTGKPVDALSPAYLLFDALNGIDARFEGEMEARLAPWRQARSQMVDQLLDAERVGQDEWRMKNPRTKQVLLAVIPFLRERLAVYRTQQDECLAAGGTDCRQLRDWTEGLSGRMATSLGQPISAAALRLLDRFYETPEDPGAELLRLAHWLTEGQSAERAFDTTLLATADLLQILDDDRNTVPIMRFLSTAIAPNAHEAAADNTLALELNDGALEKTLRLIRQIKKVDPGNDATPSTLTKLLRLLAAEHGTNGESPLEIILDAIGEVNRAAPALDEGEPLSVQDLRSVLSQSKDFLSDERHGLERLYDVLQSRRLP